MKKNNGGLVFVYLLILLVLCIGVNAHSENISLSVITNNYFTETFSYNDRYDNNDWTTDVCLAKTVSSSNFLDYSFGINSSMSCSSGTHNIWTNFTRFTGNVILEYAFDVVDDNTVLNPFFDIRLLNNTSPANGLQISFRHGGLNNFKVENSMTGGEVCTMSANLNIPSHYVGVIELDLDNNLYSWYINGSSGGCYNKTITTNTDMNVNGIQLSTYLDSGDSPFEFYVDDIYLGTGYTQELPILESCNDSDGTDYLVYGNVTYDDGNSTSVLYDYCSDVDIVNERICSGISPSLSSINCTTIYGVDYECFEGRCIEGNQYPVIDNVESYKFNNFVPFYEHKDYYKVNRSMVFNVTSTDYESDNIYIAVDCIVGDAVSVTDWIYSSYTPNCTYSSLGNYTARVYIIDGDVHGFGSYPIYEDFNVSITNCDSNSDCELGFSCYDGECSSTTIINCTDSDGGLYPDTFGFITTDIGDINDTCYNSNTVKEYACWNETPDLYYYSLITCNSTFQYCYQGYCKATTGLTEYTLYFRDANTNSVVNGVEYTLTDLDTGDVWSGTASGQAVNIINDGNDYSLVVEDSNLIYKRYELKDFTPVLSDTISLYKHCSDTCLLDEDFDVSGSVFRYGWQGSSDRDSISYLGYGNNMKLNISDSSSSIYEVFSLSNENYIDIEYDIIMADSTPAIGQEIWVYISGVLESTSYDVVQLKYLIDNVGDLHVYYMTPSTGAVWQDLGTLPIKDTITTPFSTKISIDREQGTFDLSFDKTATGAYVKYLFSMPVLNNRNINMIFFYPLPSPKTTFIDNINIEQSISSNSSSSLTNPSASDTESVWYTDAEGNTHFDASKCVGWRSTIGCMIWKQGVKSGNELMAWIFKGTHIIFFIFAMVAFILIAPLAIELFRKK